TFIAPYLKSMNLQGGGDINVDINCGEVNSGTEHFCGEPFPKSLSDCHQFSTASKSCCLFNSTKTSVCIYNTEVGKMDEQIFGYNIECDDFSVKFYYIVLLFLILLL